MTHYWKFRSFISLYGGDNFQRQLPSRHIETNRLISWRRPKICLFRSIKIISHWRFNAAALCQNKSDVIERKGFFICFHLWIIRLRMRRQPWKTQIFTCDDLSCRFYCDFFGESPAVANTHRAQILLLTDCSSLKHNDKRVNPISWGKLSSFRCENKVRKFLFAFHPEAFVAFFESRRQHLRLEKFYIVFTHRKLLKITEKSMSVIGTMRCALCVFYEILNK